ncbi:dihydrolipoamide acetyltransferase family protein [Pedobacter deserti]|uniref:dihydrolipoamide acetyltransferase family protein n=1 Tax=Pedobacter deserti TaxID=2817382 RepID=UPI00210C4CFB|nr:dihydrolipoamide acetyltransferase family protein [Pedobacter sp. SYSU D00382]
MAQYELLLPKMGESVAEATVIKWAKQPGDAVEVDDIVLEIATDKVDSEVPSPVSGKLVSQLFKEDEVAQVGDIIAIIEIEGEVTSAPVKQEETEDDLPADLPPLNDIPGVKAVSERFYSPLVKSIAAEENISNEELDHIPGSGAEGRLTKDDLLSYIRQRQSSQVQHNKNIQEDIPVLNTSAEAPVRAPVSTLLSAGEEIIEMDRMRKLIADHMVMSKQTSPHVTSFVEADVTNMVLWREKVKKTFEQREKEKITFTPLFIEAVTKAIKDYPMINVTVNGSQIVRKRDINIGMAAALPSGNLIVPVIKNADQFNLVGLTKSVNDLALRARASKLKPDETQNGTFTLTNIGSFGNVMGTPIINQPQVAILAVGAIKKKPAVLETEFGDVIAIRHMMYLSLSYDHRVVDGALGGSFVRRVADYLENWDIEREI